MPQMTGGGASGPIGRRATGSLERELQMRARMAADRSRSVDVHNQLQRDRSPEAIERMSQELNPDQGNDSWWGTAIHGAAAPGNFLIDMVKNAPESSTRFGESMMQLPQALSSNTPLDVAEGAVRGTADYWGDPLTNLREDPVPGLLDILGAYGSAAGAPASFARGAGVLDDVTMTARAGLTPSLDEVVGAAYPRSIGPFGKLLEESAMRGDELTDIHNLGIGYGDDVPQMVPSAQIDIDTGIGTPRPRPQFGTSPRVGESLRVKGSATNPNLGVVKDFDEHGMGVLKPGETEAGWSGDQVSPEMMTQALNVGIGKRLGIDPPVRMPGAARGSFDFARIKGRDYDGPNAPLTRSYTHEEPVPTSGLVSEYLPARDVSGDFEAQNIIESMDNAEQMQNISMMDYILGNNDRSLAGHNLMEYEGEPLAYDFGLGFRNTEPDLRYHSDVMAPTPAQWPGLKMGDRHRAFMQAAADEITEALSSEGHIGQYNPLYEEAIAGGLEGGLEAALQRIEATFGRDTLYAMDDASYGPHVPVPTTTPSASFGGSSFSGPGGGPSIFEPNPAFPPAAQNQIFKERMEAAQQQNLGLNAFDDIEQPGAVPDMNPEGVQSLMDAIFNPGPTTSGFLDVNSTPSPEASFGSSWANEQLGTTERVNPSEGFDVLDEFTTLGPNEIPLSTSQVPDLDDMLARLKAGEARPPVPPTPEPVQADLTDILDFLRGRGIIP